MLEFLIDKASRQQRVEEGQVYQRPALRQMYICIARGVECRYHGSYTGGTKTTPRRLVLLGEWPAR